MVWFKLEKPAAFVITDNLTGVFAPQIQLAILYRLTKTLSLHCCALNDGTLKTACLINLH